MADDKKEIFDLYGFDLSSAIPQRPEIKFSRGAWINWGANNDYPAKLAELIELSPVHQAITQLKTQLTHGAGLVGLPENMEAAEVKHIQQTFRRLAFDNVLFMGFAIHVIWSKGRVNGSFKIARFNHIDFTKVRLGKPTEEGVIEEFFICSDWTNRAAEKKSIKRFNPATAGEDKEQIIYVKGYTPGVSFYPSPDYSAAINYINLDYEISKFHINNVSNGLTPGMIFKVPEVPPEEDRRALKAKIKREFGGTDKAGRFMLLFSHGKENLIEIDPIQTNNNADIYNTLEAITTQKIITGHRLASPVLAGLPGGAGSLGSNAGELVAANQIFLNTIIKPNYQGPILETLNILFETNGEDLELNVLNEAPVKNTLSEGLLADILTDNELREMAGFEPLGPDASPPM